MLILQIKSSLSANYRVDKLLGEGSTGYVYKATNRTTGIVRAVKTINMRKLSPQVQASLKAELEMMRTIDHPHIAKVHEIIEEDQKLHVVTEFCAGGELAAYLTTTVCTENRLAGWFMQLMSAVNYLHRMRIRLKDLKLENVLLDSAGHSAALKLVNFGTGLVLRRVEADLRSYSISPEVAEGSFSDKSDIWSCGIMLAMILTGQPPEKKRPAGSTLSCPALTGKEWVGVSAEAKDLVGHMLMYDPSARPTAAVVMSHQWIKTCISGSAADFPLAARKLQNLSDFKSGCTLMKAALAYIHTSMSSEQESEELQKLFLSLDTDKDGQLTAKEVITVLSEAHTSIPIDIDSIFAKIDADGNGSISYSEFLMATTNWTKLLTDNRLEAAFKAFDKDRDGFISAQEVKAIFDEDDAMCQAIVAEADLNTDGRIDFTEFKAMMLRKRDSLV
jgi:calcium-dependent protein kinase